MEKEFRASPYRVLLGHSLGGLLAVHAAFQHPDAFRAHIAMDSTLHWDDDRALRQAEKSDSTLPSALHLTFCLQRDEIARAHRDLKEILSATDQFHRWAIESHEQEDHNSIVHRALDQGLRWLFQDWRMKVVPRSEVELEAELSKRAQQLLVDRIPPDDINGFGYQFMQRNISPDWATAKLVFEHNTRLHPTSANAHDCLGEAMEALGEQAQARDHYRRAIELASAHDPYAEDYRENHARVSGVLASES